MYSETKKVLQHKTRMLEKEKKGQGNSQVILPPQKNQPETMRKKYPKHRAKRITKYESKNETRRINSREKTSAY